ncbi:MAG: hypothetical protein DWP97_13080 [Calditrichaeota bacterium]|nr:MAG: hypothetical protein DWP97_13080 [Calditrichota bacterium]
MQVVQNSFTDFIIRITDDPAPNQDTYDYITAEMKKLVAGDVTIDFEIVKQIEKEKSGKVRFIKRQFELESEG